MAKVYKEMATPSTSRECDIPGYCYDETTKRYYKLPPRHFAKLPTFNKIIPSSKPQTVYTPTSKPSHDMSLYHLVQKRQLALSDVYYQRCLFKNSMRSLQLADTAKVPANITRANQLEVNKAGNIVVLGSSNAYDEKYKVYCGCLGNSEKPVFYDTWKERHCVGFNWGADAYKFKLDYEILPDGLGDQRISADGFLGGFLHEMLEVILFESKHCALCISPYNMDTDFVYAVGNERGSVAVFYRQTTAKGKMMTCLYGAKSRQICCPIPKHVHSAIQSLAFAAEGKKLFAGTKSGVIYGWEIQNDQSHRFVKLKEREEGKVFSSVTAIQPLKDSNYIISSAFNSKLSLWDVRMGRKVLQYKGHVNNYQPCTSQLVDKDEKYLFAAGSDKCVRVWSVGDGQLLRTITPDELPPCIGDDDQYPPPLVCYTDTMGGKGYNPALIVCNHKTLAFFKL
ncbi:uncharacterized protein LOC135344863 isoform X1 [Halichondria panicea]|uniref:uncharacterized protein LOC135344863 isoform X1 n=1 Tax=Halichondria panicea TaxID=6063 RepID=UPI00312B94B0